MQIFAFRFKNFGQNYATPLTIPGNKLDCYLVGFNALKCYSNKTKKNRFFLLFQASFKVSLFELVIHAKGCLILTV